MKTPRSRKVASIAGGAALAAALFGGIAIQPVAADNHEIVHSAGGATLVVSPGNASAISAVAEAHASPGHAHTIGAAAEAIADCEDGALTRGAAALAVAHPDEGALTQSAAREMAATIRGEVEASLNGTLTGDDGDSPIRKIVENKCGKDEEPKKEKEKEKEAPPVVVEEPAPEPVVVVEVPATGAGSAGQGLAALFALASGVATLGAAGVGRSRR